VKWVETPSQSGLAPLPVPERAPRSGQRRFLLAVVLHIISGRPQGFVSQRELQTRLNRSGRDSIQEHLLALREGKYLTRRIQRRSMSDADEYRPGTRLDGPYSDQWTVLSRRLFGKRGVCRGLLGRPAFGPRFLGHTGMLVLGTLQRSRRGLTVRELHGYLGFLIGSETTVRNRLNVAAGAGLVVKSGANWSLSPDFKTLLDNYEETSGALRRKERVRYQHGRERDAYAITLRSGRLSIHDEHKIRESGCIRCGCSNEDCVKREGARLTIEHFPPQHWLKVWGLDDHPDFNWAICPSENSRYGGYITGSVPPALDKFNQVILRSSEHSRRVATAALQVRLLDFYRSLDIGDKSSAMRSASRAASLWAVLVLNSGWRVSSEPGNDINADTSGTSRRLQRRLNSNSR
jgi:hypothetical protein